MTTSGEAQLIRFCVKKPHLIRLLRLIVWKWITESGMITTADTVKLLPQCTCSNWLLATFLLTVGTQVTLCHEPSLDITISHWKPGAYDITWASWQINCASPKITRLYNVMIKKRGAKAIKLCCWGISVYHPKLFSWGPIHRQRKWIQWIQVQDKNWTQRNTCDLLLAMELSLSVCTCGVVWQKLFIKMMNWTDEEPKSLIVEKKIMCDMMWGNVTDFLCTVRTTFIIKV